ncbi:MAG: hypothetical protein KDK62_02635 [Chlamydiia bacterium]|nr:hypothetical protein [Chlamydiia bacterium]
MIIVEIPRRARKCARDESPFHAGTPYFSRLIPLKEGRYEREDFCEACWKEESPSPGSISWKGEVPKKTAKDKREDKIEGWFELLEQLLESTEEQSQKQAYLLALFLKRKRALAERGMLEGNHLFEVIETEEAILVPKVKLTRDDLPLQELLAQKL